MQVNLNTNYNPNFNAKPSKMMMKGYTNTIKEGLNVLEKEVGLIIHNSSTPASKKINTGIGSLLSTTALASFIPFIGTQGITSIQQEPANLRKSGDPSPYSPLTPGKNIYMIPLEKLGTKDYELISERTLNAINLRNKNNDESVNFNNVEIDYDHTLWEAYTTLKTSMDEEKLNITHIDLFSDFCNFKRNNSQELTPQALYEILAKEYNNNDWKNWSEIDQNLFNSTDIETAKRLEQLEKDNLEEIDFYMFKQWLVNRELENANKSNLANGISVLGDSPVAFTPYEEWRNQDLFFKDLSLGCPPDSFSQDGQRWGFVVLKPETIFNPDGTLGKGGKLLKNRYEKMFESSSGGARIDHIIGLIDPFVYTTNEPMTDDNSGRLYSSPNHPILGKYAKTTDEEYASILEKIVIPAGEKFGLTKDDIICEDLGTVTEPVVRVMKRLGLSGLTVTEFDYRGRDADKENVIMLGSHDNPSFIEYTDNFFKNPDKKYKRIKTGMLAEDTSTPEQKIGKYQKEIIHNKKSFMKAMFTELFTSPAKRVQIFFTDFFGIGKTYNRPGTTQGCWSLRLGSDYENQYWENVKQGLAPNLPEIIATAIRQRGEEFSKLHKHLLNRLDILSEILKS